MTKITSCPICQGEIHAIAGRCKHCKADLVDLRERAARAARAQAIGATVPPPAGFGLFGANGARPSPPAPYPPATDAAPRRSTARMPIPLAAAGPDGGPHGPAAAPPAPAGGIEDAPPEPSFAPDRAGPGFAPSTLGTPPYGLGLAGMRPRRGSTWSRRWPLLVSAVALLAIGISIGVLAERWRQHGAARGRSARHSQLSRSPIAVPDHMPQPLMPAPPPARTAPDPEPPPAAPARPDDSPDPSARAPEPPANPSPDPPADPSTSNPGSRFSQPPSGQGSGDAGAFRTFTAALTDSLCDKLTQCGFIDGQTQSMCRAFAQEVDPDDAAEKVARGECSFDQSAADACLRAVADLRCDTGASDRVMEWLMAPNRVGQCAEAYTCR